MSGKNYIPSSDRAFVVWATNLLQFAEGQANYSRWRIMGPDEELADLLADFTRKLNDCDDPGRTPIQIVAKNVARKKLEKALRNFVQGFLMRNTLVNEEDRRTMQIPVRDVIPTNVPPPVTQPDGALAFPGIGLIEMRNIRPIAEKPDARAGYGVRIYYGILGEATKTDKFRLTTRPETGQDLPHSVFTRKTRYLFDFTLDRHKEAFFCMRYENSKGNPGPWGKMYSASIP